MATKTDKEGRELVEIRYEMGIPGTFAKGPIMGFFLEKLKEKELWGTRCGKCYNVIFPPRVLCPKCMVDMAEWVKNGGLCPYRYVRRGPFSHHQSADR